MKRNILLSTSNERQNSITTADLSDRRLDLEMPVVSELKFKFNDFVLVNFFNVARVLKTRNRSRTKTKADFYVVQTSLH